MKITNLKTVIVGVSIGFSACAFAQWPNAILQQNLKQAQMRTADALQEQQRAMSMINNAGRNVSGAQVIRYSAQSYQSQANQTLQQMRLANQAIDNPTPQSLRAAQNMANWAEVGRSNLRVQEKQNVLVQRNRALNEFRQNTGRDFEYTDRPVVPGKLQDEWDRCNRALQRFQ